MANANGSITFGAFVPQGWRMDLVEIDDPIEQYEAMTRVAQEAERQGYDSIWVYDHFHTTPKPELETTFEAWTITAGLARDTQRVKIGQMVTCNGYRHPAYLAKVASTVDVLSHGRLLCGLGAGWYEHEWRAYGYGFPEVPQRMGMFREAVEIVHRMFTEEYPTFKGKYYTIDGPINEPKGVQKPHPPIWLGGGGEKVTLKLVAKFGDACNLGNQDLDVLRHKLDVLRGHCEDADRDYNEIVRSSSLNVFLLDNPDEGERATAAYRGSRSYEEFSRDFAVGTPDQIAERIQRIVDAGINYIIVYFPRVAYDHTPLQRFAQEVMPRFVQA